MKILTALTVGFLSFSANANAQVLANWVANGSGLGGAPAPYDFVAPAVPGVQSANLSIPGTVSTPSTVSSLVTNTRYGFRGQSKNSVSNANAAGHYFEFEVVAAPGEVLNLTTLDANFGNGGGGYSGFRRAQVRSSVDNFGAPIATIVGNSGNGFNLDINALDLSAPQFQGIDDVTFRVTFWEPGSDAGSNNRIVLRSSDGVITLGGTTSTVIPEISSSLPLFLLLGLSISGFRRRRN